MKEIKNSIMAKRRTHKNKFVFTPAEIVDFLSQVLELDEYEVSLRETTDKSCKIAIGESVYYLTDLG